MGVGAGFCMYDIVHVRYLISWRVLVKDRRRHLGLLIVSDTAAFVLKRDVKLQPTNHLGFLKVQFFNGRTRQEGQTVSPCQMSWKSLIMQTRYYDFSIFQYGGRRRLGFLKCQTFRFWKGQKGQNASLCQISRRSVKLLLRYDDFF